MDISAKGIISKLEANAGLIAGVIGFGTWGYDHALDSVSRVIGGQVHMPDLRMVASKYFDPGPNLNVVITALGLYVGGEVLGKPALKKAAMGLAVGNALQHVLWWSTHSTLEEWSAMTARSGESVGRGFTGATQKLIGN